MHHEVRHALPAALLALCAFGILLLLGLRPPAPRPADAPADVFSAARALDILSTLLAEGEPHPVGTPANFVVRDRIISTLESYGWDVHVQRTFSCRATGGICAPVENIATRLAGRTPGGRAVMLTTHYDSRGAGPGAGDAGAAVAALLEVARIIRTEAPFANDIVLLLTDGEEFGLLGAEAFVAEHEWSRAVALAISLEARGTSGPSIMFETSAGNGWLIREFGRAVRRPVASSLTYDVYRRLPNDTDATVYRRAGMAVLNFAFIGELAHYHTALDDVAHLDPRSVQHHGDNALATLRHFADLPLDERSGDAVYADIFGRAVVHWPVRVVLPLTSALLLVLGACAAVLTAARRIRPAGAAWALLAVIGGIGGAAAVGILVHLLLSRATGRAGVFHAFAQPALIALWAGALAVVLLCGSAVARRAGFAALLVVPWLVIGMLAAALAAVMPGASVVLVLPLMVGTPAVLAATAVLLRDEAVPTAAVAAAVVGALGTGFTLIPLALLLFAAFVLQLPFAISTAVGLAVLPLLPLLAGPPASPRAGTRARNAIVGTAGAVAAAAAIVALLVPGYSAWRPQPLNVLYVEDAGSGAAAVAVQAPGGAAGLPPELLEAAAWTDELPPWLPRRFASAAAPAPPLGLSGPAVEMLAADQASRVTLRVSPSAAGNRILLEAGSGTALRIEGRSVAPLRGGLWLIAGVPAAGIVVELVARPGRDLVVWEFSPVLPPAARTLAARRPAAAAPFADGDAALVRLHLDLARITPPH